MAEPVAAAIACIDVFTERFNACDLAGMDALLHFPHVILSGETFVVWEKPGQLPATFFDNLKATGWRRSTYHGKDVVLVDTNITPKATRRLVADVRTLTDKPIRTVVNTHWHYDHADGNQVFGPDVAINPSGGPLAATECVQAADFRQHLVQRQRRERPRLRQKSGEEQ